MLSHPGRARDQSSSRIFRDCTVSSVTIMTSYLNCKNCDKEIDNEEEHFGQCSKCKQKFTSLVENFSFRLYLKIDGGYEPLKGSRKNLGDYESTILHDLDTNDLSEIEQHLESLFVGKKITVEYTMIPPSKRDRIMRYRGQKFIHKIHQIASDQDIDLKVEDEEPPKKKVKKDNQDS